MADTVYCSQCGNKVKDVDRFCVKCGTKREDNKAEGCSNSKATTLEKFLSQKETERSGFFSKKRKVEEDATTSSAEDNGIKKSRKYAKFMKVNSKIQSVVINVGIISEPENGSLGILRGSKLPIKVNKDHTADEVLYAAIEKHSNHDQFFCALEDYVLLYPDQKLVENIPGCTEKFSVEKYKKELAKPYSKLDLYLCQSSTFYHQQREDFLKEFEKENCPPVTKSIGNLADQASSTSTSAVISQSINTIPKPHFDLPSAITPASENYFLSDLNLFPDLVNDFTQHHQNVSKNREAEVFCPICNKKYHVSVIATHADDCASKSQSAYICIPDSDEECDIEPPEELPEMNTYVDMDKNAIMKAVTKAIKCAKVDINTLLQIQVLRGQCFSGFIKFFAKKWNRKKIGCQYKITFIGEAGIDTGGVSREFYSEALSEIKDQYFTGSDEDGYEPFCGMVSVADGTAFAIGHLIAASLVHNGPGPGFLAPWIYNFFTNGLQAVLNCLPKELVAGSLHYDLYNHIFQANTDDEIVNILKSDDAFAMLEDVGYRGDPSKAKMYNKVDMLRSMFIKSKIEPLITSLSEISEGLKSFNILDVVKENENVFMPVFSPSNVFKWEYDTFIQMLEPDFSETGSNKKTSESACYKAFIDFVEVCFMDENFEISADQFMKYVTGSSTVPPLGLPPNITVHFKHDCALSQNGTKCKCLPTISTCALSVKLPVHIFSENEMKEAFLVSVKGEYGFGRC